jgi:hypothetical protein
MAVAAVSCNAPRAASTFPVCSTRDGTPRYTTATPPRSTRAICATSAFAKSITSSPIDVSTWASGRMGARTARPSLPTPPTTADTCAPSTLGSHRAESSAPCPCRRHHRWCAREPARLVTPNARARHPHAMLPFAGRQTAWRASSARDVNSYHTNLFLLGKLFANSNRDGAGCCNIRRPLLRTRRRRARPCYAWPRRSPTPWAAKVEGKHSDRCISTRGDRHIIIGARVCSCCRPFA